MGMCAYGYIFQVKVEDLLGDIECVKTYIDDILVLGKDFFRRHIDQLIIKLWRLLTVSLKVNAHRCSFGLKGVPYLGYVITREGIKIYPKKVQGIMDIGQPATTTEARALISMVQYYRDMCPRQSHVLDPLIEAACGP